MKFMGMPDMPDGASLRPGDGDHGMDGDGGEE